MTTTQAIKHLPTARKSATQFTVVWGFYSNTSMLRHERFTSRKAAWTRVNEIMQQVGRQYDGGPAIQPAVLQVYVDVPGTHGYSVKFFKSTAPQFAGPEGMAGWSAQSPFISSGVYCG